MERWVRLCAAKEVPGAGQVTEVEAEGRPFCLANVDGALHLLDNVCPHRQGPLGQGWVEGNTVLCPWHAWAFDVDSGVCEDPEHAVVKVFPLKQEAEEVFVDLA